MSTFAGFTPELFEFLVELSENNVRAWWEPNKARYERVVRGPALDFIRAVGEGLPSVSPHYTAVAKKSGGSMMRPFRDTRFSKDKTPYKTNVGIQFRHAAGKDVHAPGFYVHISADECFIGAGMWRPDSPSLAAIRARIATEGDVWDAARGGAAFREHFRPAGDSLKRAPRGYAKDHPRLEDIKRKDYIVLQELDIDDILDIGFVEDVLEAFHTASPYVRFLTEAVDLPF